MSIWPIQPYTEQHYRISAEMCVDNFTDMLDIFSSARENSNLYYTALLLRSNLIMFPRLQFQSVPVLGSRSTSVFLAISFFLEIILKNKFTQVQTWIIQRSVFLD